MDTRLIVDPGRCTGTGVCLSIAPEHLRLVDGTAQPLDGTTLGLAEARAAAACCPSEALTVAAHDPAVFRVPEPIVTLGPVGTDACTEAGKHSDTVRLVESFADAMASAAADAGVHALVAAGYLALDDTGRAVDSWADQHFTYFGMLGLESCWENLTKPMCFAVHRTVSLTSVRTIATHPATRVFADQYAPSATQVTVRAKPLAARAAAHREVDACIASTDVVARFPQLEVIDEFQPTMVWLLYRKADSNE
jgi:ferredoxin